MPHIPSNDPSGLQPASGKALAANRASAPQPASSKAPVTRGAPAPQGTPQASYHIDRAETLRYLGYAGQATDSTLDARIDKVIDCCERASNPGFAFRIFPTEENPDGIRLTGTTLLLKGNDIAAHLKGALQCAVMAATAGLGNEREMRRISATNSLDAAIYGAAGSALAEAVGDACNARIVEAARQAGLYANWRYSPGYGDLPLDIQPTIVRILDADKKLGITVTDSNLLIPAKSITAFVGLFDTPQDDKRSCANCSFSPYCNLRKVGNPCYR